MKLGSPKRCLAAVLLAATLAITGLPAAAAPTATVQVSGQVGHPAGYTAADLAALGTASYPVTNPLPGAPKTVTGTSLNDLITKSAPTVPAGKHTTLRVVMAVTGKHGSAMFALGELDPSFGNHPAVLAAAPDGIDLIVPGDRNRSRSVGDVTAVRVAVSDAGAVAVPDGAVRVGGVTLPGWLLSRLSSKTVKVTFGTEGGSQTHTEQGVPLWEVLLLAGRLPTPDTAVVAVGDDGYAAAVTLGECFAGGRPLLLSTVEDGTPLLRPRLIPEGDKMGARFVSGTVRLATL